MPLRGEPWGGSFWKTTPKAIDKEAEAKKAAKAKREVDKEVDRRDGKKCRCCGRKGNPNATTTLGKIHRAHIVDASKGGPYSAENLCSLCWICHAFEHAKKLFFAVHDANKPMKFLIAKSVAEDIFGKGKKPPKFVKLLNE